MDAPEVRYARSGDANIAFLSFGAGEIDVLYIPNFTSNDVEQRWHTDVTGALTRRLAGYARVITLDKRGTGLSGRVLNMPTVEEMTDDLVAVLDAAGSTQAAIVGIFDGAVLAALFAATYPQRTRALVTWMLQPRVLRSADYPWGIDTDTFARWVSEADEGAGLHDLRERLAPSAVDDEQRQRFYSRIFHTYAGPAGLSGLLRLWGGTDIRSVLPTIKVPTLVVHRAGAELVPADVGRYVASSVPDARYLELAGTANGLEPVDAKEFGDAIEEFLTGTRPLPDPDRVLATVVFTDVVDSTERTARLGDQGWRELIARHDIIVRQELANFRGVEVKTMGDGFLARFDGPARAVRCAQAIRSALRDIDVQIRVGVHTGEIELVDADVTGIAVTIAKRIESLANTGEVLVSRTVVDLVAGSGLAFADRGDHELKGVPQPWTLFSLVD